MANEQNLRPFQPGQSGNPEGARKHNHQLKALKQMTDSELAEMITILLKGRIADFQEMKNNPETPPLKIAVASVILNIIKKGDANQLNALLDRVVGKPKQSIELSGIDGGPMAFAHGDLTKLSDEVIEGEIHRYERIRFNKPR